MMERPTFIRVAIFLASVVAIWGVLSFGSSVDAPELKIGDVAKMTYTAERGATVVDTVETERLRQEARDSVEPVLDISPEIQDTVVQSVDSVFNDVESAVIPQEIDPPEVTIPDLPEPATDTTAAEGSTTITQAVEPSILTGRVFADVDGNGLFEPDSEAERADAGLRGVRVEIRTASDTFTKQTDATGSWSIEIPAGPAVVVYDPEDAQVPPGWFYGTGELAGLIECEPGATCSTEDIGFQLGLRPTADVEAEINAKHALDGPTISYLVATAADDLIRNAIGEPPHLRTVWQAAQERVYQEFGLRIEPGDLPEAQARVRTRPPLVLHADTGQDIPGGEAAAEVVATYLLPNYVTDTAETERLRNEKAGQVDDVTQTYIAEQVIVSDREVIDQLAIDAIAATSSPINSEPGSAGLLAVVAVLVALLGFYLARFRPEFWSRPRMVALLGILVLLVAASVRATVLLDDSTSLYILPAVAFGFMTAILFDQRIALLISLAVGVLTAAGTLDPGLTVYAVLACMAPIPFVNSVSTRGAFRNAVVYSALVAGVVAAATSWFFHVGPNDAVFEVVGLAVAWAFGVSALASLVALAGLQFFESAFDITTTLSLLDLTDRNHQALQTLQEKAFGTFNHSLMVGTLADAAARAIGANALLARAMAYYHDLGKTENPTMFIENQFGSQNPHDLLQPKESAEHIREHVTAGVALAREFKIPTDVAQGIVSHHGDGVMRYFYEKARSLEGEDVDIDDYRHIGHKPRTAETAILMLADSLEAACRAVFQHEEPTADAIQKVVNRVIDEKIDDGQLSESPLTLAELTQIRKAFLDSLVGHYHQRIAYPNFPGS